jgi:hypothetical protein
MDVDDIVGEETSPLHSRGSGGVPPPSSANRPNLHCVKILAQPEILKDIESIFAGSNYVEQAVPVEVNNVEENTTT